MSSLKEISQRDSEISEISETLSEMAAQISDLKQAASKLNDQITSLAQDVAERDGQIANLTGDCVSTQTELKEANAKLQAITQSNSWRLTLPLRETRRWVSMPKQQIKRYIRGGLRVAKRVYQSLPLSCQTKASHRSAVARLFPKLLLLSGSHPVSVPTLAISPVQPAKEIKKSRVDLQQAPGVVIDLPVSVNPLVSVIIPIYGKIEYTMHCLASIGNNPPKMPFEVIVVDDCSPENSAEVIERVRGIRLLRNSENQGFIRSCNAGAKVARGEYLYFLNNDTEVVKGWLDELLRTFSEFPGTGLVGSKLVYPDGRLQEAGGIIWQDGSAWNFDRFQDPSLPVYNYAREVDYCSAASIMLPKPLFTELGGFDEHYLPAYCEDSDLALKTRDKGYRVIYQPLSTIIHYEGITSGTDTTQGIKAYQIENSKKLFERWQDRLKSHQAPGVDVDNAKDRMAKRRVLVLDFCTPTPDQDSGSIDTFNVMLLLREMDFQVTFIPEDNFLYMPQYTEALQRIGVETLYAPYVTSVEQHLKEYGSRYDLVFLFRVGVVQRNISAVREYCKKAKVLFNTIDLHYLRMEREAKMLRDDEKMKAAGDLKNAEYEAIRSVDASTVVSAEEFKLLKSELPDENIYLLEFSRHAAGTKKGFAERRDIVFIGGYRHSPNIDAVQFFVSEVMPLLRKRLPSVCFYAVGSNMPAEIQKLASEDVIITGFVEDLNPLLDKMRVSVAPLRYGAGIKGKIATAMAVCLPTVATSLAAEGMALTKGENILIADGAEAFADAIAQLYRDEMLWKKLSRNGLEFAEKTWGGEAVWAKLDSILRNLGIYSFRGNHPLRLYGTTPTINTKLPDDSSANNTDDEYVKKIQQEMTVYSKQINVHDLPEIHHYWANKYLSPMLSEAGFQDIENFFALNFIRAWNRTAITRPQFVSIGSGNCDLEVNIAKTLLNNGCNKFIFECIELNPVMLKRGQRIAKENGVFDFMQFTQDDFNSWRPGCNYVGAMANHSLHHVTNLEHLFDQIKRCLSDQGVFVVNDMIGRNGHQRWPESLSIVHRFWAELPESYKFNILLNRHEQQYINWDCSKEGFEGIRSQEILPLLINKFNFETFIGYGSAIDIFIDRCFGHHFSPNRKVDTDFIDRVHNADEDGLLNGELTPTHMLAAMVKYHVASPHYSRGLAPASCVRNSKQATVCSASPSHVQFGEGFYPPFG